MQVLWLGIFISRNGDARLGQPGHSVSLALGAFSAAPSQIMHGHYELPCRLYLKQ